MIGKKSVMLCPMSFGSLDLLVQVISQQSIVLDLHVAAEGIVLNNVAASG